MPLGYFVPSMGRTGPELRVARGTHELLATGPAARIGTLLPNHTTTTTLAPHGAPLEVRVPFLLAQWLLLGLLVISDAVGHSPVYMYMVGAERLGAAHTVSPPARVRTITTPSTSPVRARPLEAPRARCDSRGCPVDAHHRPHAEEAGRLSSTGLLQLAGVERLQRAKNEIWYLGSQAPSGGRRATRVDSRAA